MTPELELVFFCMRRSLIFCRILDNSLNYVVMFFFRPLAVGRQDYGKIEAGSVLY